MQNRRTTIRVRTRHKTGWCLTRALLFVAYVLMMSNSVRADGFPARHLFNETAEQKTARLAWWTHDRFGMFIHFGLYALPAHGEWIKKIETITDENYDRYFTAFNPDLFDAKKWAKAAKAAGMKYVVLTAKHHEGFCLWDSKFTDYKITRTPFGRDLVKEFVEAFRAEDLRIGFYYSLIDWHHPDFTIDSKHPRRPKWAEECGTVGDGEKDYPELNTLQLFGDPPAEA